MTSVSHESINTNDKSFSIETNSNVFVVTLNTAGVGYTKKNFLFVIIYHSLKSKMIKKLS